MSSEFGSFVLPKWVEGEDSACCSSFFKFNEGKFGFRPKNKNKIITRIYFYFGASLSPEFLKNQVLFNHVKVNRSFVRDMYRVVSSQPLIICYNALKSIKEEMRSQLSPNDFAITKSPI